MPASDPRTTSTDEAIAGIAAPGTVRAAIAAKVEVGDATPLWGHLLIAAGWGYLVGLMCGVVSRVLGHLPGAFGHWMAHFSGPEGNSLHVIWAISRVCALAYLAAVAYRALRRRPDVVAVTDQKVFVVTGLAVDRAGSGVTHREVHEIERADLRRPFSIADLLTGNLSVASTRDEAFFKIRAYRLRHPDIVREGRVSSVRALARLLFARDR